jgi:hypothetical protein
MPRDISSQLKAAIENNDIISPFYAVDLNFHNGTTNTAAPVYLWTGIGDLSVNSNVYQGAGDLMAIDGLEEAAMLSAQGMSLTFSGINDEMIIKALTHEYSHRVAKVYFGSQGISELTEVFSGYMDTMVIDDSSESSTIKITLENRLIDLDRINPVRYTQESHSTFHSDDTFFSYVSDMQDKQVEWGS